LFIFISGVLSMFLKKNFNGKFFLITSLIIIIIIGLFFEHVLFGSPYPLGRTGIFFIPLFGLFIYYLTLHILNYYSVKKVIFTLIMVILSLPVFYNFYLNLDVKRTYTWYYDTYTKDAMKVIENIIVDADHQKTISNEWLFEPTINYYIYLHQLNL